MRSSTAAAHAVLERPRQVLVVDEDLSVGRAVMNALGRRGDVLMTTSTIRALDILEHGASFDLILCAPAMAELRGDDLWRVLRDRRPDVAARFVFLVGAGQRGIDGAPSLAKPIDAEALCDLVA